MTRPIDSILLQFLMGYQDFVTSHKDSRETSIDEQKGSIFPPTPLVLIKCSKVLSDELSFCQ